jgi:hypothetical protein
MIDGIPPRLRLSVPLGSMQPRLPVVRESLVVGVLAGPPCRVAVRPRAATAVASGGATAAPRTRAGAHGTPSACAMAVTAKAVATTSSVLMIVIPRKSRLIDRSEVERLSQKSIIGRKMRSTISGSSSISRSCERNPSASPMRSSSSGVAIRSRGASTEPAKTTAPSVTTVSSPFMAVPQIRVGRGRASDHAHGVRSRRRRPVSARRTPPCWQPARRCRRR